MLKYACLGAAGEQIGRIMKVVGRSYFSAGCLPFPPISIQPNALYSSMYLALL